MKSETLWAVFDSSGHVWPDTARYRRKWSVEAATSYTSWKALYKRGYRCRRIRIEVL